MYDGTSINFHQLSQLHDRKEKNNLTNAPHLGCFYPFKQRKTDGAHLSVLGLSIVRFCLIGSFRKSRESLAGGIDFKNGLDRLP